MGGKQAQAKMKAGELVSDDIVIGIAVPDEILEERICGRWIHKASGRSYHVKFAPPRSLGKGQEPSKDTMLDDETGEPLIQRPDDTAEALVNRLKEYHAQTQPLLVHYRPKLGQQCAVINGNQKLNKVWKDIKKVLPK